MFFSILDRADISVTELRFIPEFIDTHTDVKGTAMSQEGPSAIPPPGAGVPLQTPYGIDPRLVQQLPTSPPPLPGFSPPPPGGGQFYQVTPEGKYIYPFHPHPYGSHLPQGMPPQMPPPQGHVASPGQIPASTQMSPPGSIGAHGQLSPENGYYMPMMAPHPGMHMMHHPMNHYGYPYPYQIQPRQSKADSPMPEDRKSDEDRDREDIDQEKAENLKDQAKKKRVKRTTVPFRPMRRPQGSSTFVSSYPTPVEYQSINWREQLNVRMGCWGNRGEAMARQAEFRTQMIKRSIELDKPYEDYDYEEEMRPALKKVLAKMQKFYGWDMNTCNDVAIRMCMDRVSRPRSCNVEYLFPETLLISCSIVTKIKRMSRR